MKNKAILLLTLFTVVIQCYAHFNKECNYCKCKLLLTERKGCVDCIACGPSYLFHDIKPLK